MINVYIFKIQNKVNKYICFFKKVKIIYSKIIPYMYTFKYTAVKMKFKMKRKQIDEV